MVSMQGGGGSKDTWVLGNAVQEPVALGAHSGQSTASPVSVSEPPVALGASVRHSGSQRALSGVPSRAADNLFWLGRYTERLEQRLRVLRCVLGHILEQSGTEAPPELLSLAELMANLELAPSSSSVPPSLAELQQHVLQLVYKPNVTGSVRELLERIRFIASTVRDRFSGDTWRILRRLDGDAHTRPGRLPLANATGLIHTLVLDLAAFNGMEMENMTRGRGWRFLDFGRRVERALSIVNLLRAAIRVQTRPASVLEPVLEMADSVMTYRRRYFAEPRLPGVLELLLRDETNPRSLAFQINELRGHARALVVDPKTASPQAEQQRIASLAAALGAADLSTLATEQQHELGEPLLELLGHWAKEIAALSDDVTSRYFSHTAPRLS
jgi:uncharacterized alpha-E superfamily protein